MGLRREDWKLEGELRVEFQLDRSLPPNCKLRYTLIPRHGCLNVFYLIVYWPPSLSTSISKRRHVKSTTRKEIEEIIPTETIQGPIIES